MKTVLLSDKWSFRQAGSKEWLSAVVPGNVHSDLLSHGRIPDPYYGTNESVVKWIEDEDWEYECCFIAPKADLLEYQNWDLVFAGLDTYADVYLNDSLILSTDNMFRSYPLEIKNYLHKGINRLRIYFHSPLKINKPKLKQLSYTLPASNDTGKYKVSVFTRKAPYHFGWDWGPRLVTCGVWKPVYLICWNDCRITSARIIQDGISETDAHLTASLNISCALNIAPVKITIEGYTEFRTVLHEGHNTVKFPFTVKQPSLWFPRPLGVPNLYDFKFVVSSADSKIDSVVVTTGLRKIELVQKKDSIGTSFFFKVNDIPLFIKGADYIPQDNLLNRVTPERYNKLIHDAVEANMNMLRVWGGGIYEDDLFYKLCDKHGLLVWQDFMFACSLYPGDKDFLDNVSAEAEEQVSRLSNFACLALWCGNNEIEIAWKYWGWQVQFMLNKKDAAKINADYDMIFKNILPGAVNRLDGTRPYVHTSPLSNWGKKENYNHGSMHYWGVWHGDQPFEDFKESVPRFMVEYGFQSFPSMPACRLFAAPEDMNVNSAVMKAHQKSHKGSKTITAYMKKEYRTPASFEEFIYYSHLLQGSAIEYAIKQHRLKKGHCMGTLFWQLNDSWPGPSWSAIDYSGRKKALYYRAGKAYKPLSAIVDLEDENISVWLVSDVQEQTSVQTEISIRDFDGRAIFRQNIFTELDGGMAAKIFDALLKKLVSKSKVKSTAMHIQLRKDTDLIDEQMQYFVPMKSLQLPKPEYTLNYARTTDGCILQITAKTFLKDVYMETDLPDVDFSDNYFDMFPGVKTIHVLSRHSAGELQSSIRLRTLVQ